MLFVSAIHSRAARFAARFVSDYQHKSATETEGRYLRAWPEVYLPGGGCLGFDPTQGIVVADGHAPVAASAQPLAPPRWKAAYGSVRWEWDLA